MHIYKMLTTLWALMLTTGRQ